MGKPRKSSKGKRKNPAFPMVDTPAFGGLMDSVGTFAVTTALNRCTFQEKALIASLIPFLLKIIRTVPKGEQQSAVEKLWPPPEEVSAPSKERKRVKSDHPIKKHRRITTDPL